MQRFAGNIAFFISYAVILWMAEKIRNLQFIAFVYSIVAFLMIWIDICNYVLYNKIKDDYLSMKTAQADDLLSEEIPGCLFA